MDKGQVAELLRGEGHAIQDRDVGPDQGSAGRTVVRRVDGLGFFKLFLQAGRKPDREAAALILLADSDLPVPRLLGSGSLGERRWVLVTELAGSPPAVDRYELDTDRGLALQTAIGEMAGALHNTATPPAYGPWSVAPETDAVHFYRTRSATLASEARAAEIAPRHLVDALDSAQAAKAEVFRDAPPPVLVHRDLGIRNVLVAEDGEGWRIAGLFDFEASGGGDFAEEFRWVALYGLESPLFAAFADGYRQSAPVELPIDRLRYHLADVVLDIFCYAGKHDAWLMSRALESADLLLT